MKFSFLLCTSNSERVLTEVLESIVSQRIDHKLIEIILADYNSTDQTIEIVKNITKKKNIKFNYINCTKPGKTPALELALDSAIGNYSVIVDDDNILNDDYIEEATKLLEDSKLGSLGSQGVVDKNLLLPDWFSDYEGHYAIGIPEGADDWVWGACCIINMTAWKKLRQIGYELQLNPIRENHSTPIELGGEDTELSLAINMIGYKVKFSRKLKFIHKFEQKRLNQAYFLKNCFGVCRSIPILEIYRIVIYQPDIMFPKIFWILILLKSVIGCTIRIMLYAFSRNFLKVKYNYKIICGVISGLIYFRKNFYKIYYKLVKIKKSGYIL
jgi:glycosyltransferase involved in cell wall biosynthesis